MTDHLTPPDLRDQIQALMGRVSELERRSGRGPGDWQDPAYQNAWAHRAAGDREVRFYRSGERCYLEGEMASGVIGATAFVLPDGLRPTQAGAFGLLFPVVSNGVFGLVRVFTDGRLVADTPSSNVYVDLSSISFRCV